MDWHIVTPTNNVFRRSKLDTVARSAKRIASLRLIAHGQSIHSPKLRSLTWKISLNEAEGEIRW